MTNNEDQKLSSKLFHYLEILALIVAISGVSGLTIYQYFFGKNEEEYQKMLDEKVSELCDEIDILNMQLQYYTSQKEYWITNGEGNKVDPATMLNYHPLSTKMEEIHKDYYFMELISYMNECGYDVDKQEIYLSTEWFFRMEYEQQAKILSQMFIELQPLKYKLANAYEYYADETDYGEHIEYTNIRAEATDVDEVEIQIFICRQQDREFPFHLIKINEENENALYSVS